MSNNVYGIDLGTNNFKVYSKATGKTMLCLLYTSPSPRD